MLTNQPVCHRERKISPYDDASQHSDLRINHGYESRHPALASGSGSYQTLLFYSTDQRHHNPLQQSLLAGSASASLPLPGTTMKDGVLSCSGCRGTICSTRPMANRSRQQAGFSGHGVPSLSNTAKRSSGAMMSHPDPDETDHCVPAGLCILSST